MVERADYWSQHLAAIKAEGITTQAYAKREGLSVNNLYYWRKRLNRVGTSSGTAQPARHFVAVQVHEVNEPLGCQLRIGPSVQLDLPQVPNPQ
jgi:transposase-like protein